MKKNYSKLSLVVLLFFSTSLFAQEVAEKAVASSAGGGAWDAYMEVGPMHKMLSESDGDWKAEMKFWMEPGAAPQVSSAKCSNQMILGGRYQESKFYGTVMDMPFEGQGLVGYDNIKKVFISTWVDNMGTGIARSEGPYDEKSNSMTLKGAMMDPVSGKEMQTREVFTFVDGNNQKLEMFTIINGKEVKTMEINYSR